MDVNYPAFSRYFPLRIIQLFLAIFHCEISFLKNSNPGFFRYFTRRARSENIDLSKNLANYFYLTFGAYEALISHFTFEMYIFWGLSR